MKKKIGVNAEEYEPPRPWKTVYFSMCRQPGHNATSRVAGSLTDRELSWVARVISAEIQRRNDAKILMASVVK